MPLPLTAFKTPGVYVQEIRKLPLSVAQVATAIPAFIGYTEKAERNGGDLTMNPTRIESLAQYEEWFGQARKEDISVGINTDTVQNKDIITVVSKNTVDFKMNYALEMYYANGGGACYIVSVGSYNGIPTQSEMKEGLDKLVLEDEPTLLVFPDAVDSLGDTYLPLIKDALSHCNNPKVSKRFTIIDVRQNEANTVLEDAAAFRQLGAGLDELKYGSAYYPYLDTTLVANTEDSKISIVWHKEDGVFKTAAVDTFMDAEEEVRIAAIAVQAASTTVDHYTDNIKLVVDAIIADASISDGDKLAAITAALAPLLTQDKVDEIVDGRADAAAIQVFLDGTKIPDLEADLVLKTTDRDNKEAARDIAKAAAETAANLDLTDLSFKTLDDIKSTHNSLYNTILNAINTQCRLTLPPSSAMAGVYARVDASRGVHKAPANVGVNNLIKPARKTSDSQQDDFNVDTTGGKSINLIRSFTGIGTLVWGARTLAGNDNEWRYTSVRRFFNMVEESVKRSLRNYVFEANNLNTWTSVRATIENFLETQWQAGALLGATPEEAFSVRVGIPDTFSTEQMLEGYMVVEIGMAVVRPAEFIILEFFHQFPES